MFRIKEKQGRRYKQNRADGDGVCRSLVGTTRVVCQVSICFFLRDRMYGLFLCYSWWPSLCADRTRRKNEKGWTVSG